MEIKIKLHNENTKLYITYKLNEQYIERIKNIVKKYLNKEICSLEYGSNNDGFWKLALDIEQEIYDDFCICEDLVYEIYMELKYNIAFKVLDKYLRS